jgi:D-alanine-D-alanine ligase-like ATP-grasp enzyme/poly-gamma-glutamate capsule biosynthesis protein CapA/YwtB (metallophosphatase superfamily)
VSAVRHNPERASPARALISRVLPARRSLTLVFAGDTSLGDWYLRRDGGEPLERLRRDPMSFFRDVEPLLRGNDLLVANFESVLADDPTSKLDGKKLYLGWDKPDRTLRVLQQLGVDAVSLANNHTVDFGPGTLEATASHLERAGIVPFGTGRDAQSAAAPFRWDGKARGKEQRVYIIGAVNHVSTLEEFGFYATADRWGVRPLRMSAVSRQIKQIRADDPGALIILFPHWGRNYRWAGERMWKRSRLILRAGADLIIGHGAHMLQEVAHHRAGTVVFSLGNLVFNSLGRYKKFDAPPYSAVARLHLVPRQSGWEARLHLYPIVSDNTVTEYRPRPVDASEAKEVYERLRQRATDPGTFSRDFVLERDSLGWRIALRARLSPRFHPPAESGPRRGRRLLARMVRPAQLLLPRLPTRSSSASKPPPSSGVNSFHHRPTRHFKLREFESHVLELQALSRGLATRRFNDRVFIAWDTAGSAMEFSGPNTAGTSQLGKELMNNKAHSRTLLEAAGVPVPRGREFALDDRAGALAYADDLGWPVVVKPVDGSGGRGVSSGITSAHEFHVAHDTLLAAMKRRSRRASFLVEEHVDGSDYRFYVLDGEVLSVLTRRRASVVGDGRLTVSQLVARKNRERQRNPHLRTRPLALGASAQLPLSRQGLASESVPAAGQVVELATAANLSQGGESVEIYDETHPSLMEIAGRAATAVPGVLHVGVDFLIPDHRLPATDQKVAICEVNGTPGATANDFPMYGAPRPVTPRVFERAAELRGVRLHRQLPPETAVRFTLVVRGCADPTAYDRWLLQRAAQLNVTVRQGQRTDNVIEYRLHGRLDETAALATRAIQGTDDARPVAVDTRPEQTVLTRVRNTATRLRHRPGRSS